MEGEEGQNLLKLIDSGQVLFSLSYIHDLSDGSGFLKLLIINDEGEKTDFAITPVYAKTRFCFLFWI